MILKVPPIKAPKNWEVVPVKLNEFISLNSFKKEIRNCVPQNYPWRLRKQYISGAGCLVIFFTFKVLALLFFY